MNHLQSLCGQFVLAMGLISTGMTQREAVWCGIVHRRRARSAHGGGTMRIKQQSPTWTGLAAANALRGLLDGGKLPGATPVAAEGPDFDNLLNL